MVFFSLIVAFAALIYASYLHIHYQKRGYISLRESEERKYRDNMSVLGITGKDVDRLLRKFSKIADLVEANKKLEKAVKRYKLDQI